MAITIAMATPPITRRETMTAAAITPPPIPPPPLPSPSPSPLSSVFESVVGLGSGDIMESGEGGSIQKKKNDASDNENLMVQEVINSYE